MLREDIDRYLSDKNDDQIFVYGTNRWMLGYPEEALYILENLFAKNSGFFSAGITAAQILNERGITAGKSKKFEDAMAAFSKAIFLATHVINEGCTKHAVYIIRGASYACMATLTEANNLRPPEVIDYLKAKGLADFEMAERPIIQLSRVPAAQFASRQGQKRKPEENSLLLPSSKDRRTP